MDQWSNFVTISFPDGRERKLPLAQWNDEMQSRIEDAGGTFVLPEDPADKPPPKISEYLRPKTIESPQGREDEESPEGIKELLLDIDESLLSEWEHGFLETVKDWYGPLTIKQIDAATKIVRKYRRRR